MLVAHVSGPLRLQPELLYAQTATIGLIDFNYQLASSRGSIRTTKCAVIQSWSTYTLFRVVSILININKT